MGNKFRHEYKYLITPQDYYLMRQKLKSFMNPDPNVDENGEYRIRSLYFDDIYDTALSEKNSGISEREKFRIRVYNESDEVIKLERKSKVNNYIHKESAKLTREEYNLILNGEIDFLLHKEKNVCKAFYIKYRTHILKPSVIVEYVREPYCLGTGNTRVTFDMYLRAGPAGKDIFDPDIFSATTEIDNQIILEVKYDNYLPGLVRGAVKINYGMIAASKYVLCRSALENYNLKGS